MKEDARIYLLRGPVDYGDAYKLQKKLLDEKLRGDRQDSLILTEHNPVITLGRGFKKSSLLADQNALSEKGVSVVQVERGGDATYHGPGQLVGYPIFDLSRRGRDLRFFITAIEEAIILTLKDFGVSAGRKNGYTGVWHKGKKIASIGVAVKKWIAYHGFALNIFTDLKNFSFINPCGLDYNVMTSAEEIVGRRIPLKKVEGKLTARFEDVFDINFI